MARTSCGLSRISAETGAARRRCPRRTALWRLPCVFMYLEPPCSIPVTVSKMSVSMDETTPDGYEALAVLPMNDAFHPNFHERQISSAADSPQGAPELISPCSSLRGFGCVTSETPSPRRRRRRRCRRPRNSATIVQGDLGLGRPKEEPHLGVREPASAPRRNAPWRRPRRCSSIAPSMSATTNGSTLPADRQRSRSELASAASARPIGPPARRPEPEGQCQRREARGPHQPRARRTLAPRDDRTPSRPRPLVEAVSVDGTGASVRRQRAAVTSRCRSR
jgi:hypothetical protein